MLQQPPGVTASPALSGLSLPDAELQLWPAFLAADVADRLLTELQRELPWRQDRVTVFGREHPIPRLHSWHGDAAASYRWSGLLQEPCPWTPALDQLRRMLEARLETPFNSVLANLYRDGRDRMGWHADNEPELGPEPVIASISLGAERDLKLRYRQRSGVRQRNREQAAVPPGRSIRLPHGSLLVMSGPTQRYWQHSLPQRLRVTRPRINLTFRQVSVAD